MRNLLLAFPIAILLSFQPAFSVDGITKDEISIGSINALTGPTASYGLGMSTGAQALYERVNSQGGVNGRKIKYKVYDDGYEPERAVKLMEQVEKDKVFALVGSNGTPSINAVLPAMKKLGLTLFFPYSGGNVVYDPANFDTIFAMRISYAQESELMIDYVVKNLKIKDIGVFYQDDAFGVAGRSGVAKALSKYDLSIKGQGSYQRNSNDVTAGVEALLKDKPKAIYIQGVKDVVVSFVKKCHEKNYRPIFLGPSILGSREVADALGPVDADIYISEVVPLPTETSIPLVKQYNADMKALGKAPDMGAVAMEGYLAATAFVEALKAAGPEPTVPKVKTAIEKMGGTSLMGIPLGFTSKTHVGMKSAYIYKINTGKLDLVKL